MLPHTAPHVRRHILFALALLASLRATSEAHAQGVVPLGSTEGFAGVNGNKVVIDGHTLRLVYADAGRIYFTSTANCGTWSAPVVISGSLTNCATPTIGVDDEGALGVAFVSSSSLYYIGRPSGGSSWTAPAVVATTGDQPSLQCSGANAHLAFRTGAMVRYATFSTGSGPPGGWNTEVPGVLVQSSPIWDYTHPAIAVTTGGEVYVAMFEVFDGSSDSIDLFIARKGSIISGNWGVDFDTDLERTVNTLELARYSVSATVSGDGEIYVVASDQAGMPQTQRTIALRGEMGDWTHTQLNSRFTECDVSVLERTMRVVYAEQTVDDCPTNYVHRTDYDWKTRYDWMQGDDPVLVADEIVSTGGRYPQALFYSKDDCGCDIWGVYATCDDPGLRVFPGSLGPRLPVAHWTFDFPNRGFDSSGFGHDGALDGSVAVLSGVPALSGFVFGYSPQFTLTGPSQTAVNEFSIPHEVGLDFLNGMSGSAWIRPYNDHDAGDAVCSEGTIFTKASAFWFQVNSNNSRLELQNEGSGGDLAFGEVNIPTNQWTHVAFTRSIDGHTVRFYANGAPIVAQVGTLTNAAGFNVGPITLGNHSFEGYGHCEFNGQLDEVKIWDYCVSDAQIAAEYARVVDQIFFHEVGTNPDGGTNPAPILKRGGRAALNAAPGERAWDERDFAMHVTQPFSRHGTEFRFSKPLISSARITIFDVAGRSIRVLDAPVGTASVEWDGRTSRGDAVAAGVYLARYSNGENAGIARVVIAP